MNSFQLHKRFIICDLGRQKQLNPQQKTIFGNVKSNELVRLLEKDGWFIVRQTGSHMIMEHPVKKGKIVCPFHSSQEVGKGLSAKILKDAGLTKKD